jgi:D-serine deaminase-like pyridoxal phosphate-dependent protein
MRTVGRHWSELETPALLLDVDLARGNIARMAARAAEMPVAVRPHFKAHKCIEVARLQIEAGAIGLTAATLAEAAALFEAGLDGVLLANQIVQPSQIEALAELSVGARVSVLVDQPANLKAISAAALAAGGPEFEFALTVTGTVISRHDSLVVLDCGHKAVSTRLSPPRLADGSAEIVSVDEEHLRFDASDPGPRVGDRLRVVPGFGPLTINLYERFHVISEGSVVDEWPVVARR